MSEEKWTYGGVEASKDVTFSEYESLYRIMDAAREAQFRDARRLRLQLALIFLGLLATLAIMAWCA